MWISLLDFPGTPLKVYAMDKKQQKYSKSLIKVIHQPLDSRHHLWYMLQEWLMHLKPWEKTCKDLGQREWSHRDNQGMVDMAGLLKSYSGSISASHIWTVTKFIHRSGAIFIVRKATGVYWRVFTWQRHTGICLWNSSRIRTYSVCTGIKTRRVWNALRYLVGIWFHLCGGSHHRICTLNQTITARGS